MQLVGFRCLPAPNDNPAPLKINCEIFIMGYAEVFKQSSMKVLLLQPWTRIELRMPFIHVRTHVTACIVCITLFYQMFIDLFCHFLLALGLNTFESSFKQVLKLFSFFRRVNYLRDFCSPD